MASRRLSDPHGPLRPYRSAVHWLGHRRWFAWLGPRLITPLDRALYRVSSGRVSAAGAPVLPELMLTTIGRKSGARRTVPLIYAKDGDRLILTGSNWGRASHPAWAENLLAKPEATVRIGDTERRYRAVLADEREKRRLWPLVLEVWPAYATYERRSGRSLRVFALQAADEPSPTSA
jgi:deazaflavin-dependent oxidoreductase (nitroreductase family)